MCYPKPGPRCSAHAAETLIRAKIAARNAPAFTDESWDAKEKVKIAELEYDATPAGMAEIKRRLRQNETAGFDSTDLTLRLQLGEAKRAERLAAIKAQDKGDVAHDVRKLSVSVEMFKFGSQAEDYDHKYKLSPEITENMVNESSVWLERLDTEEMEALSWYTSNGSGQVNRHLLGYDTDARKMRLESAELLDATAEHLDSALGKTPREEPLKLYRGISMDILEANGFEADEAEPYLQKHYTVGSEVTSPVFMSSTLSYKKANSFSTSNIVLEIKAKKAGAVSNISAWGVSEAEYVLPRNQKYRVVNVFKNIRPTQYGDRETHIVQLEEL